MMKVVLAVRVDRDLRDQLDTLAENRQTQRSTVVQELLAIALSDRHIFVPLPVAKMVCQICQTARSSIRHLDNVEAEALRRQLESQGMTGHPDVTPARR
jgi:hypothetical protein